MSTSKHINIAVVGKLELGGNILSSEMAHIASKFGDVISGDYLDKKNLPGRKELFHIVYSTSNYECEHINAPFIVDNIVKMVYQADAIILLIDLVKGITNEELIVLKYLHGNSIVQIIVVLVYNAANQLTVDLELIELAVLDAKENLREIGFEKIYSLTGMMPAESERIAADLIEIIDRDLSARAYNPSEKVQMFIEKVYYVTDKGIKNAAVAYGYLHSGIILPGMELKICGLSDQSPEVRVRSVQIFGHEVNRCEPGRSVAILLERVPKNHIEPGQMLVPVSEKINLEKELFVTINIPNDLGEDPLVYFSSRQQFEVWFNMGKISGRWVEMTMKPDGKELIAKIKLEKPVVVDMNKNFLVSVGNQLCVGNFILDI
jgi:translation elongation factor EF-Tu-like GTPase